jgi:hypothetical protein
VEAYEVATKRTVLQRVVNASLFILLLLDTAFGNVWELWRYESASHVVKGRVYNKAHITSWHTF